MLDEQVVEQEAAGNEAKAAEAQQVQRPARPIRFCLLVTDGTQLWTQERTMSLLEAKAALEMTLASINQAINTAARQPPPTAQAAPAEAKAPAPAGEESAKQPAEGETAEQ